MATSVLILLATTASGIVLARALGPTGRGILTAAALFAPLIANMGGLGIADAIVYRSGRSQATKSPALITALCIGAFQSVILFIAGWVAIPRLLSGPAHVAEPLALVYLAYIPLFFANQYPLAAMQGRLRLVEFNLVRASVPVVYTATLVLLWILGALSVGAALAAALGTAIVATAFAIFGAAPFASRLPSVFEAQELLRYGLQAHVGNLATIFVAQLDVLMLAAMVTPRDLGYYAVATSAAMTGSLLPTAASMVLFPTFANRSPEAMRQALARFLFWGLGGALLLAPVLALVVPWAVAPVYGPSFRAAAAITLILVPAYLLRGSGQMLVAILRGIGRPIDASVGQIVGLIVLAALLPFGIAARGAEGAALAVTASAAVAFAWLLTTSVRYGELVREQVFVVWHADLGRVRHAIRERLLRARP